MKLKLVLILMLIFAVCTVSQDCLAKRATVYTSAKVESFGGYVFSPEMESEITSTGECRVGKITVEGAYNGEYPWIMRVYTDNANYTGIGGSLRKQSPAGLVSSDGRFIVPLKVRCPNYAPSDWRYVPDINQDRYRNYIPSSPKHRNIYTDVVLMGIDPRNADWVSGSNSILFDADDNILGDTTIETPFDIEFKAYFDSKAVKSNYTANLYIEIVPSP